MLILDLASIVWIVLASFLPVGPLVFAVDMGFGLVLLGEFVARHAIRDRPWHTALRPLEVADFVAILTLLLSPVLHHFLGFLRVLRMLRLLNSARIANSLREDWTLFRQNEEAVMAATQLVVFLFIMTGIVFESRGLLRPDVENYGDALYFVVTTLTTTGFGDFVPRDTGGRMLAVFIMLAGVTLFLRLAQALFRPRKVRHPCPTCGLQRHEADAVHCKSCGTLVNIPNDES
ncbi:potassium channel family protein [Sabulicella glaciei]|uniref:Potassium channel family protein n=1 Tax=Sabulicella glaciei TaxID=2984948 RepID=A0ABT3NVI8_9PROT|nr:potassium channel family protein [Roseococcus sp. MDT2-1-1]MCW8086175.1 potassium channel family protein [Roseococcus sp. MDT2-1-1]